MLVLSHALGYTKEEKAIAQELNREACAYNASALTLPQQLRTEVSALDEQLASAVLSTGSPVDIAPLRYEEVEEEEEAFEMLPSVTRSEESALARATAEASRAPSAEERVLTATRPAPKKAPLAEEAPEEVEEETTAFEAPETEEATAPTEDGDTIVLPESAATDVTKPLDPIYDIVDLRGADRELRLIEQYEAHNEKINRKATRIVAAAEAEEPVESAEVPYLSEADERALEDYTAALEAREARAKARRAKAGEEAEEEEILSSALHSEAEARAYRSYTAAREAEASREEARRAKAGRREEATALAEVTRQSTGADSQAMDEYTAAAEAEAARTSLRRTKASTRAEQAAMAEAARRSSQDARAIDGYTAALEAQASREEARAMAREEARRTKAGRQAEERALTEATRQSTGRDARALEELTTATTAQASREEARRTKAGRRAEQSAMAESSRRTAEDSRALEELTTATTAQASREEARRTKAGRRAEQRAMAESARRSAEDTRAFDGYTSALEAQYAREAERLAKANRKSALTQLTSLKNNADRKRREVVALSVATQRAKQTKTGITEACALELNARSQYIEDLSRVAIMAHALQQVQTEKSATDEIERQVREFNSTARLLPKEKRAEVGTLPRRLGRTVVETGTLPTFITFRVDEDSKPIDIISYTSAPDTLPRAMESSRGEAESREIVLPVSDGSLARRTAESALSPKATRRQIADARALDSYSAAQEAQMMREADKKARRDRKSAEAQLALVEKEITKLRREVQAASVAYRQAKAEKASLSAPLARELNARADLVTALSRALILADALEDTKKVKSFTASLRAQAQAYNSSLRLLPKEQRKLAVPMDKNPGARVLAEGALPTLLYLRVEDSTEAFEMLPTPTESRPLRKASEAASRESEPEEFYIPSHATVQSAAARLSRKEATKQMRELEAQQTEARRELANAEATRLIERREKQPTTVSTVASLNARASIIEINARMLALASSQGQKQAEKRATRTIDSEVRVYNADIRAFAKTERIKVATLPENLSESIAQGAPMTSIPRIRLESFADDPTVVTSGVVVGEREDEIVLTPTPKKAPRRRATREEKPTETRPTGLYATPTASYHTKQLTEHLAQGQKEITSLKRERTKEERRLTALEGGERIASILCVRNYTARIIATLIETVDILRTEKGFSSELRRAKRELTDEVRRYNQSGESYRKETGKRLAPLSQKLATRVSRGQSYESPKIIEYSGEMAGAPKSVTPTVTAPATEVAAYENLERRERAVSRAERRARDAELSRMEEARREASALSTYESAQPITEGLFTVSHDYVHIEALNRHEYRQYLKASEKKMHKLEGQIASYEKQNKKAKENDTHASILSTIASLERDLCELLLGVLKTAVSFGATKDIKKYSKLSRKTIASYNRHAKELTRTTGNKYPEADLTIPERIVKGKPYDPIPAVPAALDLTRELRREESLRRAQSQRERRQKRIDDARLKKQKQKTEQLAEAQSRAEDRAPMSKADIEKYQQMNIALMTARFEEELYMLEREIVELERQFTLEPKKIKKSIEKRKLHMRQLKMEMRDAIRDEKLDNARYFALLSVSPSKLVTRRMSLQDAMSYQNDLMQLMRERIALSERILALYHGVHDGTATQTLLAEKLYLASHNKALKRYNGLTRHIRQLQITVPQKEELFELINNCARAEANVVVEKRKLRMFKLRQAARKAQKKTIGKAKEAHRRAKLELKRCLKARERQDEQFLKPEHYIQWFFALIAVCVAGVVAFMYREPLWELFKTLISLITKS